MRTKGYKCYNIKCGSCVCKTLCGEPADTALGCASRMVIGQTNADRIRSMTDEELAQFLSDFKDCAGPCLIGKGIKECSGICATKDTLAVWLRLAAI